MPVYKRKISVSFLHSTQKKFKNHEGIVNVGENLFFILIHTWEKTFSQKMYKFQRKYRTLLSEMLKWLSEVGTIITS